MKVHSIFAIGLIGFGTVVAFPAFSQSTAEAAKQLRPEITWSKEKPISADVNCDGRKDIVLFGESEKEIEIAVYIAGLARPPTIISFPKSMLCSQEYRLRSERQDTSEEEFQEMLGETPEGFHQSKVCRGLNFNHGECDSMHIYWNHKLKKLDAWRL